MRPVLVFLFFLSATLGSAQEQEKKLLDRLLKPDMSLQNDGQGKAFVAGGATITKKAPVKAFYVAERKPERSFWNTRNVSPKEFPTDSSRYARSEANLSTRSKLTKINAPYSTAAYSGAHDAAEARKAAPVSDFAGNRNFIPNGKSQKSLSAQDKPMTIDQVRELLNKTK